jgi:hypothetical protein
MHSPAPAPTPTPRLTAEQQRTILNATTMLLHGPRQAFLHDLSEKLNGRQTIGDGELYRILKELQRLHWRPPQSA